MQDSLLRENFSRLIGSGGVLFLHEDYAGMGTCGSALVAQWNALKAEVADEIPDGSLVVVLLFLKMLVP